MKIDLRNTVLAAPERIGGLEFEVICPVGAVTGQQWKLTASDGAKDLKFAVDGDSSTRYTTGKSMAPGMWVQIELPEKTKLAGVILDAATSRNDFPRGFEVTLSEDGKKWNKPVAKGKGETARTEIDFDAQTAKFVRITQTGSHKLFWSIHELDVLGAAD